MKYTIAVVTYLWVVELWITLDCRICFPFYNFFISPNFFKFMLYNFEK